jgi:hypothetical protein
MILFGFIATVLLLIVHLSVINDYSINWDFHHVFFAGLYHLKHPVPPNLWHYLPFVDPDPRRMVETPFGPLQSVFPVASYITFFEKLKILAFDSAYNLPSVIHGVIGVFIIFLFLYETRGISVAWLGFLFLALYPRYFGDLQTNVKDVPTAVWYTLSIYLAWRAVNRRKIPDLILAGIAAGITFNFKVNAIFIPIIVAVWSLWLIITPAKKKLINPIVTWQKNVIAPIGGYFIIACLSAYTIWSIFWVDPYNHLAYLIRFFQYNTINMEVLLNGNWFCSGVNVPWYYPFIYLGAVTPVVMLVAGAIGLIILVVNSIRKWDAFAPLVLIWFIIPLSRFMLPNSSVIDGIRHFEEIVFPLTIAAAIGANWIIDLIIKIISKIFPHKKFSILHSAFCILLFIYLLIPIIIYHPYQLSYFNEIVGGAKGAIGRFDLDYWAISQKRAVGWVNDHAPLNSNVFIVMSGDTAGKYLRSDLLQTLNTRDFDRADYTIVLNRQSFFYRYFYVFEYLRYHNPTYTVTVAGAPMAWVFDNHKGVTVPPHPIWWKGVDTCIQKYW